MAAPRNSGEAEGNHERPAGMEGVEIRKGYYNPMRVAALRIPVITAFLLGTFAGAQQAPLQPAARDSHEGMTISAAPWTDAAKYKEKFPKKSPYSAGIVAVQVSFRNDSDDSVKVNLSRIRMTVHLDADNTQKLPSLSAAEFAQAVLKPGGKNPTATPKKLPLPLPLPTTEQ